MNEAVCINLDAGGAAGLALAARCSGASARLFYALLPAQRLAFPAPYPL